MARPTTRPSCTPSRLTDPPGCRSPSAIAGAHTWKLKISSGRVRAHDVRLFVMFGDYALDQFLPAKDRCDWRLLLSAMNGFCLPTVDLDALRTYEADYKKFFERFVARHEGIFHPPINFHHALHLGDVIRACGPVPNCFPGEGVMRSVTTTSVSLCRSYNGVITSLAAMFLRRCWVDTLLRRAETTATARIVLDHWLEKDEDSSTVAVHGILPSPQVVNPPTDAAELLQLRGLEEYGPYAAVCKNLDANDKAAALRLVRAVASQKWFKALRDLAAELGLELIRRPCCVHRAGMRVAVLLGHVAWLQAAQRRLLRVPRKARGYVPVYIQGRPWHAGGGSYGLLWRGPGILYCQGD
eukprot:m.3936 g.3936  ORF g.3936 m.3936 type:complete len:354 (+) comp1678_c0_seq1:447-1508(+)